MVTKRSPYTSMSEMLHLTKSNLPLLSQSPVPYLCESSRPPGRRHEPRSAGDRGGSYRKSQLGMWAGLTGNTSMSVYSGYERGRGLRLTRSIYAPVLMDRSILSFATLLKRHQGYRKMRPAPELRMRKAGLSVVRRRIARRVRHAGRRFTIRLGG